MNYPHGNCDCCGGLASHCCLGTGPAAYEVTRDGQRMKVCTKCLLSRDKECRLLVTEEDDAQLYVDYDAVGAFCVMNELAEARQMRETVN